MLQMASAPLGTVNYWERWVDYGQDAIKDIIGKREPLTIYASFHPDEKAVVGELSIPIRKRNRYSAVTEIHYHNGCNELALLLWGILARDENPMVSPYINAEDFESARNENRFHKARIRDMKFRKLHRTDEHFLISVQMTNVHKQNRVVYVSFRVGDEAVTGRLLYEYEVI